MATPKLHLRQKERNKLFFDIIKNSDFPEWKITAIFYCVLHLMNWHMHVNYSKNDEEIRAHKMLNEEIKNNCSRALYIDYMSLYNNSRKARYNCIDVSKDVEVSQQLLTRIEKEVRQITIEKSKQRG